MQTKLDAMKVMVIRDMFVRTADENYITARWCAANMLMTDFLWLAFHATEKYLKAALLLNGRSVRDAGHDIVELFDKVSVLADGLLPPVLTRPPRLRMDWRDVTLAAFVEHLARQGNPDNRYLVHGHETNFEDMHRLDALVFAMRRVCHPLDALLFDAASDTHRSALRDNPHLVMTQGLPLDTLVAGPDTPLRQAALKGNFAFAPPDFPHGTFRETSASHTASVDFYFFDLLTPEDPEQVADAHALGRWLLDSIKLPKALQKEIAAKLLSGP